LRGILSFVVTAWSTPSCRWRCTALGGRSLFHWRAGTLGGPSFAFIITTRSPTGCTDSSTTCTSSGAGCIKLITAPNGSTSPARLLSPVRHRDHRLAHDLTAAALGVTPDAAALGGFIGFAYAMFQHLNIRTPRWLGYIIQRPKGTRCTTVAGFTLQLRQLPAYRSAFGTFRTPPISSGSRILDGASAWWAPC